MSLVWVLWGVVGQVEWEEAVGTEAATLENNGTKPFEKQQWVLRQQNKFGRSEEEALSAWARYEASPMVVRDNLGWKGCLRLWLEHGESRMNQKKKFVSGQAVEGSDRKKKPKLSDRDAFRMHALEGEASFGHEFFQGRSTLEEAGQEEESATEDGEPMPAASAGSTLRSRMEAGHAGDKVDDAARASLSAALKLEPVEQDSDSDAAGKSRSRKPCVTNIIASRTSWFTKSRRELVPLSLSNKYTLLTPNSFVARSAKCTGITPSCL